MYIHFNLYKQQIVINYSSKIKNIMKIRSLLEKVWKSLAVLAIFFGLFSTTGLTFNWYIWIFTISFSIGIASYWHLLEQIETSKKEIIEQFINTKNNKKTENGQEKTT